MSLLQVILCCVLSYAFGAVVSIIVANPSKSFEAGYEAAKEMYADYDRGFKDGVAAAVKVDSDWNKGFHAGWNSAFEALRDLEIEE